MNRIFLKEDHYFTNVGFMIPLADTIPI